MQTSKIFITLAFLFISTSAYSFESKSYSVEHSPKVIGIKSKHTEQLDVIFSKDGKTKTIFELHISEYPFKHSAVYCDSEKLFAEIKSKIEMDYKRAAKLANKSDCEMKIAVWKSDDGIEYGFDILQITGFSGSMQTKSEVFITTDTSRHTSNNKQISSKNGDGIYLQKASSS